MFPSAEPLTALALSALLSVVVGTALMIAVAIWRRRQQDQHIKHLKHLHWCYSPVFARVLADKCSSQDLAALQTLPLADREVLITILLSSERSDPVQLVCLQELCAKLGLIEFWQRRLIGQPSAFSFQELLSHPDGLVNCIPHLRFLMRARCARNLGALRHQPSWPLLLQALWDPHPDVQYVALRALAAIREPRSFPVLVKRLQAAVLGDSPSLSQHSLKTALADFPLLHAPQLLPSLRHSSPRIRLLAMETLRQMVKREVAVDGESVLNCQALPEELIELLTTKLRFDLDPEVRARAAEVIAHLDHARSTAFLCELLHDPQWFVRLRALRALAERPQPSALAEIRGCLGDPHWRVREATVQSLLAFKLEGVSELFEYFLSTPDRASRAQVVEQIERLGLLSAILDQGMEGQGSLECRMVEALVGMGATNYMVDALKGAAGLRLRRKFIERFGGNPNPRIQAQVRFLATLEAQETRQLPQPPPRLAA